MEIKISRYYEIDRYSKSEILKIKDYAQDRIKYISSVLTYIKPKTILELGCGEGSLAYELKKFTKAEVHGVDLSEYALQLAKMKGIIAKKQDLNKKLDFKNNSFDLVFSNQTAEHIYNTDLFFQESYRVVKKSGYFIVITPNLSFWLNRILFLFGIYPIFLEASMREKSMGLGPLKKLTLEKQPMGHIRVFNLPALKDMVNSVGFTLKKEIGLPVSFNVPKPLQWIYNILEKLFAKIPSLASDICIVAKKT